MLTVSLGLSFWVNYYLGRSNGKSTAGPFSTMVKISALNRNTLVRESSFNMTRWGDEDIEGGLRKFLDTQRGGSEKTVALGGGLRKFVYFKTNT